MSKAMSRQVRLQKISIRNYRSCIHTQLSPHPDLSCLIGHNSSGKTSILHAIRLLRSIFAHSRGVFEEEGPLGTCGLKAEFMYGTRQVLLRLEIYYSSSESGTDEVIGHRAAWNFSGVKGKGQWLNIPVPWLFDRP